MAGLSYVHGASEKPLIGKTIGTLFDETARRIRTAWPSSSGIRTSAGPMQS